MKTFLTAAATILALSAGAASAMVDPAIQSGRDIADGIAAQATTTAPAISVPADRFAANGEERVMLSSKSVALTIVVSDRGVPDFGNDLR
jgi:hypothetical protein